MDRDVEPCWIRTIERLPHQRPLTVLLQQLPADPICHSDDQPTFILLIGDPEHPIFIDHETLQHLHGLTPAESHVVALLVGGKHLNDAARTLGISVHTARTHLKRIFSKTQTSSQAALVRLVLSIPSPIRRA
jgi:DNA-binding CsgD family transcriptional regulator